MPWPDKQRKAIAARLVREGKSREQVSEFFRKHGHGGERKGERRKRRMPVGRERRRRGDRRAD